MSYSKHKNAIQCTHKKSFKVLEKIKMKSEVEKKCELKLNTAFGNENESG